MKTITIESKAKEELIDITAQVREAVKESGIRQGMCIVYTPHTSAAVTVNESDDPRVVKDILLGLKHLKFESANFTFVEGNSPAHVKASIIGCSMTLLVDEGSLLLGTWQGVFLCEFDGPRSRKVHISVR